MDPVLENVLVELRVDPADADVPIIASAPERTWIWSDLHLSDPSVLLGWGRPFRSVEEMNWLLLRNWRRRVETGDTVICLGDVAHPDAWRDDRLVLDLGYLGGAHRHRCPPRTTSARRGENRLTPIAVNPRCRATGGPLNASRHGDYHDNRHVFWR